MWIKGSTRATVCAIVGVNLNSPDQYLICLVFGHQWIRASEFIAIEGWKDFVGKCCRCGEPDPETPKFYGISPIEFMKQNPDV